MGHSPSIKELQEKDEEFRNYLDDLEKDLKKDAADAIKDMDNQIKDFYSGNKYEDAKEIVKGGQIDFLHEKEFSLENLSKMIGNISAAVFGGAAVPKGTSANATAVAAASKALGPTVGALSNLELYISGKVFDLLSEIIISFGTGSSVAYSNSVKNLPLGFGMQMFTCVAGKSFESKSYFVHEYISQYLYNYEIRFSMDQAKLEIAMGLIQTYENQLTVFEAKILGLTNKLEEGTIDPVAYKAAITIYMDLIHDTRGEIADLKASDTEAEMYAALDRVRER